MLSREPAAYQWALPDGLDVPEDELQVRLDFHRDAILMYVLDKEAIHTRLVSALEISRALTSELPLCSELLPQGSLWWASGRAGPVVALWRPPRIWKVALMLEAFQPPQRFSLPLPGLIFICSPAQPPLVYAVKRRPESPEEKVYHAPLFNVYRDGRTCPGNHHYPDSIAQIPESFFLSFFSPEADHCGRSKKYPQDLLKLWQELNGKKKYPLSDLVELGKISDLVNASCRISG